MQNYAITLYQSFSHLNKASETKMYQSKDLTVQYIKTKTREKNENSV